MIKKILKLMLICLTVLTLFGCYDAGDDSDDVPTIPDTNYTDNYSDKAIIHLVNNSSYPVYEYYISHSDSTSWGSNQLTYVLVYGANPFSGTVDPGTYDFCVKGNPAAATGQVQATLWDKTVEAGNEYTWSVDQDEWYQP